MRRMIQFSVLLITVFVMLIISCNMPQDPFKKPSNSKVRLFPEKNEQTIKFGSEVMIGVSIFLAEHIEALHVYTRNNGLDTIHSYSSNAIDDTLYFNWKFIKEGVDTIFVIGKLKDKSYKDKSDTLPIFILPAPDSIRFDSIPQSFFTVTENHDTLQFIASSRSEKPLSFSVKSQPALDTNQLKIAQFKDTACVVLTTDFTGEYAVTLYAQRDTLIDSAFVNVTVYEPLVFETAVLSDVVPLGKRDTLVFTIPSEREDTITYKLINKYDFAENELSFIVENSDSLVIVFTPDSGGEYEFLLLLNNGKISDTLKYSVTVDDHPSVGLFIENHEDTVSFGNSVNIGVSVFLPQLIKELHLSTSDNSLDSTFDSSEINDTMYVSHKFYTEGEVKIYVTAKPVNSDYEEKIDSLTINVLPAPEKISFDSIPGKLHTVTGLTDTLLFLAKSSKGNALEFSVKSDPALDSNHLEVVQSNDTTRVIVSTDAAGKYGITLYAQRDTVKDSAEVDVISYDPLAFETAVVPDMIALGSTDSFVFIVPTEREDTLICKLLNKDDFSETEISVLTESADSLVIAFTPEIEGQREFVMLITNGHIEDTLRYEVFVSEKIPVWNITEKAIDAVEGEEISVDLRTFINESFSGDFSLDSDLGEINDSVWKWTPSWGSAESRTAEISAVCDSDEYKLKLNVSVAEGDTTGPTIRPLHSSLDDTIIGSSQITIAAIVTDSQAGISSVTLNFNSKSSVMTLRDDSIYEGSVTELEKGQRTKIKIIAEDGSMQKNSNEFVFYITYDSTIGDNEAPVITQVSGPENNSRITNGQIPLSFSVTDDSDIDSAYWTLDGIFKGTLSQNGNIYSLFGTLDEYGSNEIEIFAVDKSVNRNRGSLELVFDYNTEITGIDIISPEDDISDIDTSNVTFKWSGGNDEDGDTVFVELLYDTSKTSLTKKITGINCDTLDLTEKLKSYTEYFWQVVAYSKVYPDTVKSSIYSFKTEAVPPVIKSQPNNMDVDIGERIVLRISATGNPKPSYKWEKNGTAIIGETDDSLVISDASLRDSGGYVVQVNNEGGTVSDTIDLRVIYPVKIAAGNNHSLILKNDGTLFGCGLNKYGQLGYDTTVENITTPVKIMEDVSSIAAGYWHSMILKNDGTLLACGYNSSGQLGDGTTADKKTPVQIATNVKTIALSCRGIHSLILKNDGTLFACGWNGEGQLGDTTTEDKSTPIEIMKNVSSVAAGGGHSLIIKNDGTLYTCGDNNYGQLGDTVFNLNYPVKIMENVKAAAGGDRHSLIIKDDGTLFACGWNGFYQLGDGTGINQIFPVEIMENIKTATAGHLHSLILGKDGTLFVCGSNTYGELGAFVDKYETPEEIMKDVKAIAAGANHSLILKDDGTLLACGWNYNGQLGDGTTEDKIIPVQIIPKQN